MLNLERQASRKERESRHTGDGPMPKGKPGRKRKDTVPSLPNIPEGDSHETLTELQKQLEDKCKSGNANNATIKQLMESTYPLRRHTILTSNVRVWEIIKQYPPFEASNGYEVSLIYNVQHYVMRVKM